MLRLSQPAFLIVAALAVLNIRRASAQVTLGADAGVYSAYVWRGLTLSSKPVFEPDLYLAIPVGGGAVTVGGWANIELGRYDGTNDISEGGGLAGLDLTEFDWWAEYVHSFGKAAFTAGATGYIYPNKSGTTSSSNTVELYGRLGLDNLLSPRLSAYYDVDKVKGLYLEGQVNYDIPLSSSVSLTLGALGGFDAGQGCEPDSKGVCQTTGSNYFDNGLTHVDLSASTAFSAGPVSFVPAFHFQINSDAATKMHNANPSQQNESTKIWFGITASWTTGGSDEE